MVASLVVGACATGMAPPGTRAGPLVFMVSAGRSVERGLVETLPGAEVDADCPVHQYRGKGQPCPLKARADGARAPRGGREHRDAPAGKFADRLSMPFGHDHIRPPQGAIEVRGDEPDHAFSMTVIRPPACLLAAAS